MADVAGALELFPAPERFLRDLAHGEDRERMREAAHERAQRVAPLLHFLVARLAVAGRPAGAHGGFARFGGGAVRMPRECVPQDHLACAGALLELAAKGCADLTKLQNDALGS